MLLAKGKITQDMIALLVEDPVFSGDGTTKEFRKNWARLIQKIYETNPLCCPKLVLAKAGMPGSDKGDLGNRTA